jgi:hypothetical protein
MYLKQRKKPHKSGRRKSSGASKSRANRKSRTKSRANRKSRKGSKASSRSSKRSKLLKSPKRFNLHQMASLSRMNRPFIGSLSGCGMPSVSYSASNCLPCGMAKR